MAKILTLILTLFVFITIVSGQQISHDYIAYTEKADSCFLNEEYRNAVDFYIMAFKANNDKAKVAHRYKLASCWALLGNADSAFVQLTRIAEKSGFSNYEFLAQDINFKPLRTDSR